MVHVKYTKTFYNVFANVFIILHVTTALLTDNEPLSGSTSGR